MTDRNASIRQMIAKDLSRGPAWTKSYTHCRSIILQMLRDREITRIIPVGGTRRNMIGLTQVGAERFGYTGAPIHEPEAFQLRPRHHKPDAAERAEHKLVLADHVANGGTVVSSASDVGMSKSYCQILWREILAELGPQAV